MCPADSLASSLKLKLFKQLDVSTLETEQNLWMEKVKKNGDRDAFERLYHTYKTPLFSYMVQSLRNQAVAEELMQEVFLRIYRSRDSFTPGTSFKAWIWTIARNTLIDAKRKHQEILSSTAEEALELENKLIQMSDAETLLIEKSDRSSIEKCLNKLKSHHYDALTLRIFSELSYDEIAKQLNQSTSAIKTWIFRAKEGLIKCLSSSQKESLT